MALDGGGRIAPARVAWRRYGPEPAQARAVVLLLHGISGSQQALAPVSGEVHPDAGWASGWLGPGAALDTRHTCVLAPNALGSCFGSSAPDAELPASFPDFTITDSVRLQGCGCARWALRGWMRWWAIPTAAIRRSSGRSIRPCHSGGRWRWRPGRAAAAVERRDRVAAPGRRAAGRRCLGARAVGRGAAGRLDALWPGPVVGRCRRARARAGAGRRGARLGGALFALVDGRLAGGSLPP